MIAFVKKWTSGPWYANDLRASTMRALGLEGPCLDSVLIQSRSPRAITETGDGSNCIIARITFDQRPEELGESNWAEGLLMAASPDLYNVAELLEHAQQAQTDGLPELAEILIHRAMDSAIPALLKARGEGEQGTDKARALELIKGTP